VLILLPLAPSVQLGPSVLTLLHHLQLHALHAHRGLTATPWELLSLPNVQLEHIVLLLARQAQGHALPVMQALPVLPWEL
jgi:hypothetical protein